LIQPLLSSIPSDVIKITDNQGWGDGNVGTNLPTTGGTGTGLTVDVIDGGSGYAIISINTPGTGYTNGDVVTVTNGGMSDSFTIVFSGTNSWEFDVNGAIVFPDATIQTTAFIPTTYATTGSNTFIGNQVVTGSGIFTSGLTITGSLTAPTITGSLEGTSSWSRNSISSSYPIAISGNTVYTPFSVSNFSTSDSIFLGFNAGTDATNADSSIFLGGYSGIYATNAYSSIFLGNTAGGGGVNAHYSNFLGNNAGGNATYASNSNFLGKFAGFNASKAYNSNFIGQDVGNEAVESYHSNFLGYFVGVNAVSASFSTLIGYKTGYNSAGAFSGQSDMFAVGSSNGFINIFNFGQV
jgi:hypothetical protein